jgi:hypothetical protein
MNYKNNIAADGGRYHVRKSIGGHIYKRTFPTKRSALMYIEHLVLEAAGVYLTEITPTLTEAIDAYVRELTILNRSHHTLNYYALRRKPLEKILGDVSLDQITQPRINEYVEARQAEVGNGTINKEIVTLRTIFTAAQITPRWRLKSLSHRPKRKRVQPPGDVRKLWHALTQPVQCAVGLCLFAGFRAEEVWRAHASWIHGDEIDCEMEKSGGDTNRTWLVGTLRDILPARGKLVTKSESAIRYELERESAKLDITPPYMGPGAFRGHCSTYAADLGFPRDEIKLVLGHQFGDVTDRYIHSQQIEKKRKLLEAVERHVFGWYNPVTLDDAKGSNVVSFGEIKSGAHGGASG